MFPANTRYIIGIKYFYTSEEDGAIQTSIFAFLPLMLQIFLYRNLEHITPPFGLIHGVKIPNSLKFLYDSPLKFRTNISFI